MRKSMDDSWLVAALGVVSIAVVASVLGLAGAGVWFVFHFLIY
jgi:cbb3-type cytochrome oxidase subunit 3